MSLTEKEIETCQQVQRDLKEKVFEFIGSVWHSSLSPGTSPCANAMDDKNESELIYEMTLLITAWTECKISCE